MKDVSYLADEVLEKVSLIDKKYKIFPMFGTLLSLYRDKGFKYADDFDFASFNTQILSKKFILELETIGLTFYKFSFVGNRCVEVCFRYRNVRVDFFLLSNNIDCVVHDCPNFRTTNKSERRKVKFLNGIRFEIYPDFYRVNYERIALEESNILKLFIPSDMNCENIFVNHYGSDWKIPKKSNFIDYKCYDFINEISGSVYVKRRGHRKLLELFLYFIENKSFSSKYSKII